MSGPWEKYQSAAPAEQAPGPWAKYQKPAPAAAPEADGDASLLSQIMDMGGQIADTAGHFAQEAARGVTNVVGAPVDLVNASPMLLNLLPGEQGMTPMTDRPIGGSEHLWDVLTKPRDALQAVSGSEVGDSSPDNAFERIGGRVAEELGAAALPGAGVLLGAARKGVKGARAMQQSAVPAERMLGSLLESAAANPSRFVGKETLYATGAGVGAGGARELVSDGDAETTTRAEATADLLGAIFGAGATGAVDAAQRTGRDVLAATTGAGSSEVVRDAVAGEVARAAGAPTAPSGALDTEAFATALSGGSRVGKAVPGFQESTADVLQNPGVASLEYSRQSGENAGAFVQRRDQNARAVNDAIEAEAPEATPGAFRETLSAKRDDALLQSETEQYLAQTEFEAAADKLTAAQSGEARGQTVRAALDDALEKAKEVERAAWAGIDGSVDPTGLDAAFDEVTDGLTLAERQVISGENSILAIPGRLTGEVDEEAALLAQVFGDGTVPSDPVRLAEVTTLRSTLTDRTRAARSAGDHNTARVLDQYVGAIDQFLDETAPDIVEQMEAARAVTRDLNDRFTRPTTPIAQTLDRNQGQPRVPDSEVAGKFVRPDEGQASNIDALLKETDNAADVRAALEDQIKAGAQKYLDKPDQLEKYLDQFSAVFEKFPELRDEFDSAAVRKRAADAATDAHKQTQRDLGTETTAGRNAVGRYLRFGDERAVDAMAGVVNAPDPAAAADELLQFTGGEPKAVEGAKSAFWKLIERDAKSSGVTTRASGGEQTWRPQSLRNFLQNPKNRAVMERLYANDPEQMARIDEIANALAEVDMRVTAKAPNSSGTPQALQGSEVLPSTETVGAYSFAYQRGQVGLPFIGLRLVSTMARKATLKGRGREFQELLDKALLEPEVAELLLREHNPANVAAMTRSAKLWLGNRAPAIAELLEGEESEQSEEDDLLGIIEGDSP